MIFAHRILLLLCSSCYQQQQPPHPHDYNPILIDWGVADYPGNCYDFANRSIDFLATDIFLAQKQWEAAGRVGDSLIPYAQSYDQESIEYTVTAIQHRRHKLEAPWSKTPAEVIIAVRKDMCADRFAATISSSIE